MSHAHESDTAKLIESSKLPKALHLANGLEETMQYPLHGKAADELRRLYTENLALRAAIEQAIKDEREAIRSALAYITVMPTLTHGALVKLSDVDEAIRQRSET